MKQIIRFIFSSPMTIILLSILALVLAAATFIEDKYDTQTARLLVYQAKWFEGLFILLIINLFGHIKQYNLLKRKKWAGLLFHSAFIIIIIGAGITRYFGFEGSMHIREGQTSNIIYTSDPYLQVSIDDKNQKIEYSKPLYISSFSDNAFHIEFSSVSKGKIELDYKDYIPNAVQKIVENVAGGKNIIELIIARQNDQQTIFIENGTKKATGNISVGYNNTDDKNTINIVDSNGVLTFVSDFEVIVGNMSMKAEDTIPGKTATEFQSDKVYGLQGAVFHLTAFYKSAKTQWVADTSDNKGTGVL
ncbi:MAG: cytochrome c biogenesis protein ResB, partial [Bacteroidota bacterium]